MQHLDLATVRATVIPADSHLAIDLTVGAFCRAITGADAHPFEVLPVDDFHVEAEETLIAMTRPERHRHFKGASKARTLDRKHARAQKRAASYIV